MDDKKESGHSGIDFKALIRNVIEDFVMAQAQSSAPAYKNELAEERRRREDLERRINELSAENVKSKAAAEEADRMARIRAELSQLGVTKVDMAFRIVKDDIRRTESGQLVAKTNDGEVPLRDYLNQFVSDNPEFLPARISGGSGMTGQSAASQLRTRPTDLEHIRPGMNSEQLQRLREQISQVAAQTLKGD